MRVNGKMARQITRGNLFPGMEMNLKDIFRKG